MPNPAASPPPAPATAVTRRQQRRRRRQQLLPSSSASGGSASSSSSSSTSSGGLSFSFPSFSPAPSPFHHRFFLSPLRASAVPFSWEHRPGIPKTPARQQQARGGSKAAAKTAAQAVLPLPLPPSLLFSKVGAADDGSFSSDGYFIIPDDSAKARRRRQRHKRRPPALAATLTDWLAVLSLYRSCTRSRDCLAGTPPRPRAPPAKAAGRLIHYGAETVQGDVPLELEALGWCPAIQLFVLTAVGTQAEQVIDGKKPAHEGKLQRIPVFFVAKRLTYAPQPVPHARYENRLYSVSFK